MPIVITIYAILLCLPAAILTWFSFEEGVMGCGAIVVQILGLPGTILISLVRLIMWLCQLPQKMKEDREREERERRYAEEKLKLQKQEEERQESYQKGLTEKRNRIYPNSPVTREIVNIVSGENEYPYSIEITRTGLTFNFENKTRTYVLRSHGLPDFDINEERIFADVLNQKLGSKYIVRPQEKIHSYDQGDGTTGYSSIHIGTIMELKVTRTF